MVDLNENTNGQNARLLLEGMWYNELPNILDIERLKNRLPDIVDMINNKKVSQFEYSNDDLIIEFKDINSPPNIYKPGVEAITYYSFKNNKSWREMQVPNIIHYIAFIYNTISVFDELFYELYLNADNNEIVSSSNSYLVFGETFSLRSGYEEDNYEEDNYEDVEMGIFTTKNNKINYSAIYSENKKRFLKAEGAYIYSMKMDIESFFPNMYTHFFSKIKNYDPYDFIGARDTYFDFLDKYNMRINNNQTKGIPAGVFSSHISAELCMLCVDREIRNAIGNKKINYIRYVDDLTFFSDSEKELDEVKPIVQKILNEYRLRINGNKTEMVRNTRIRVPSDIFEIYRILPFLHMSDQVNDFEMDDLYLLKKYIFECLNNDRISQIKSVLSNMCNIVEKDKLNIHDCEDELFCYLLKLVWDDESFSFHIYKLLDKIIEKSTNKEFLLGEMLKKTEIIDTVYPDTILQIWHYFVYLKYIDNREKKKMVKNLKGKKYNPLIISLYVIGGDHNNQELFKYIMEEYVNETSSSKWKMEIMFSKWWLPIFKIRLVDKHNYQSFINSNNFPEILRVLCDVPINVLTTGQFENVDTFDLTNTESLTFTL